MTAFYPAVVALTSQGVASQCSAQGYQETSAQFLHLAGVVTPLTLAPGRSGRSRISPPPPPHKGRGAEERLLRADASKFSA
jgi:hypothetical protein